MSPAAEAEPPDAPGPPPYPPADLSSRALPVHVLPAGTRLFRIHSIHRQPLFFGPAPGAPPRGRWDAPAPGFGVCYLGEAAYVAFAETFLREPGETLIEETDLATRSLSTVELLRDVELAAVHGAGLARIGATAGVCNGPYRVSRAWSLALHGHAAAVDGLRYRARHDDDGMAVVLFDRAADTLRVRSTVRLNAARHAAGLAEWLDRYGIGLV